MSESEWHGPTDADVHAWRPIDVWHPAPQVGQIWCSNATPHHHVQVVFVGRRFVWVYYTAGSNFGHGRFALIHRERFTGARGDGYTIML